MPVRAFFDTNVLIYALAKGDPRSRRAEELLAAGGVLSVQILNEFVSVARRRILMSWERGQRGTWCYSSSLLLSAPSYGRHA